MYMTETPDGVVLNVKAQPRSSRAGLDGFAGDAVKVRIRSAPVDGKANKELVETLADEFGTIRKGRLKHEYALRLKIRLNCLRESLSLSFWIVFRM